MNTMINGMTGREVHSDRLKVIFVGLIAAFAVLVGLTFAMTDKASAATGTNFGNAINIPLGSTTNVKVTSADRYLKFKTSGNDSYYFVTFNNSGEHEVDPYLYDSKKTELDYCYTYAHEADTMKYKLSKNSTHYIKIVPMSEKTTEKVYITVKEYVDNAGDDYQHARILSGSHNGTCEVREDEDWFKFTAPKAGTYRFKCSNKSDRWIDCYTYNQFVTKEDSRTVYSNNTITKDYKLKAGQVMYFMVDGSEGGTYQLSMYRYIKKPAKGKITKVKAGKRYLKVKYAKKANASKYQLQVKRSGKSWKKAKTYECGKKLTKKVRKLKKGKKYTVRVRAVRVVDGKAYAGKWSKARTVRVR